MGDSVESHADFYRRWHRLAGPYFQWQFRQFEPWIGQRVADVGCGPGNLTACLLDRELYLGIDRDPEMLNMVREEYGAAPAVTTLLADVSSADFADAVRSHGVDTVLCLNLLEHIRADRDALGNLVAALPPRGVLGLLVPALPALFGSLDVIDGHVRRYTRRSLIELLAGFPLEIMRMRHFNILGALGWWWEGRVRRAQRHADVSYAGMNAVIPVLAPIERFVAPPFGLSLVVVARRH